MNRICIIANPAARGVRARIEHLQRLTRNVVINGNIDASSGIFSDAAIGDPVAGTTLTLNGYNLGVVAAKGAIATPPHKSISNGWVFANASGANGASLDAMFIDHLPVLGFDFNPGDGLGLAILEQNLLSMKVAQGNLVGP